MTLTEAEQFFYDNGAWNIDRANGETPEEGRVRCARESADDERKSRACGWHVEWELDADADTEPTEDYFVSGAPQWEATLFDEQGNLLEDLCGIDFGYDNAGYPVTPDDNPPYRRAVEAQLAGQALRRAL